RSHGTGLLGVRSAGGLGRLGGCRLRVEWIELRARWHHDRYRDVCRPTPRDRALYECHLRRRPLRLSRRDRRDDARAARWAPGRCRAARVAQRSNSASLSRYWLRIEFDSARVNPSSSPILAISALSSLRIVPSAAATA